VQDIEKACFEANCWVTEYVPPDEVTPYPSPYLNPYLSPIEGAI